MPYFAKYGSEEQKEYYMPKLVSGEIVSAIAMTEPGRKLKIVVCFFLVQNIFRQDCTIFSHILSNSILHFGTKQIVLLSSIKHQFLL